VDVRTAKEFDINHVVGAINIPVDDIKKQITNNRKR